MTTTQYFEEVINDQGGKGSLRVEFGRSSFYSEDSIYLMVDDKSVVMDRKTAEKFVNAAVNIGHYHGFLK